jgi:hypothetical protein
MVYNEIMDRVWNDRLAEWFREREDRGLCVSPTDDVWKCVHEIGDHVVAKYGDRLARPFLNGADLWVLAHAKAMGVMEKCAAKPQESGLVVMVPRT